MPLTDEETADAIARWKRKKYPKARPQDLESLVMQWLNGTSWYSDNDALEQIKLKHRILRILRSRAGQKGVRTHRKNILRKQKEEKAKRQLILL